MDNLDEYYYSLSRVFLSSIGLWAYDRTWLAYVKRVSYLLLLVSAIIIQIRSLFFYEELNSDVIFDSATNITFTVTVSYKYAVYLYNLTNVKRILQRIHEDWRQAHNEIETRLLLKSAKTGKYTVLFMTAGIFAMLAIYLLFTTASVIDASSTTTEDDYGVIAHVKLVYAKDDEKYFAVSLAHTYIVLFSGLLCFAATESSVIIFAFHVFGLFDVLRFRVVNAISDDKMDATTAKKDSATMKNLINVAILHCRVLRFRNLLDETILTGYFFTIFLTMASLTLNLLRFSYALLRFRRLFQVLPTASVIVGHFLIIGVLNVLGQMVIDCTDEFFLDTYASRWYTAAVPAQKLLLFIMCHSMRSLAIVFGGIFCPSCEGFTKMTKLSVSYLMVMYSLEI